MVRHEDYEALLTIRHMASGALEHYKSSGTVWYSSLAGIRQTTAQEGVLADVYDAIRYYKDAGDKLPQVTTSVTSIVDDFLWVITVLDH